ncbi:hypothetical protein PIB30_012238 [Stylosanthes scabra]|uniref:Uncharacterized protein n=1 Tax=Stylosanthes scabra TaxID=79078 RepID=A0ABU6V4D9_9FABA|nr:hypothetical protein [Stylosanthes scabra]
MDANGSSKLEVKLMGLHHLSVTWTENTEDVVLGAMQGDASTSEVDSNFIDLEVDD